MLAPVDYDISDKHIGIQLLGEKAGSSLKYPGKEGEMFCISTFAFPRTIPAGESFTRYLSYTDFSTPLCVQPPTAGGEAFWRDLGSEFRIRADVYVNAAVLGQSLPDTTLPYEARFAREQRYLNVYGKRCTVSATSPKLRIRPRPDAELRLIEEAVKDVERRASEKWAKPGFRWYMKTCLTLVPDRYDTPAELQDYENRLSPGTLRDTVHLYRLTQALYEEKDESKGLTLIKELLAWLDTLPEVERHSLAFRIQSILPSDSMKPKVRFELYYGLADRLPARYRTQDYRESHLWHGCDRYGKAFAAFLRTKGEQYPWIDTWLNPPPTPEATSPALPAVKTPAAEKSPSKP